MNHRKRLFGVIVSICLFLSLSSSSAQWLQIQRSTNTVSFLFAAAPRLERYSVSEQRWLAPINLPSIYGLPTAFCADDSNIFVAYGTAVKRYDLSGGNELHILNAPSSVISLHLDGDVLFVNYSGSLYARFTSVTKSGAIIAAFENYIDAVSGSSIAPSLNKIFGRSLGISPADITYVSYNSDGTFISGGDSPHHGDYPGASRTWVFPDEAKVVDDSGTIYNTGNLTYVNSLGGAISDLDFYGRDIPIALRGSTLIAFSNSLLPAGSRSLSYTPQNIAVAGTNVFTFSYDAAQTNGVRVEAIPLSDLKAPTPGQPVNPVGLAYTPDASFLDTNGVLHLFSKAQQSIFRWDTVQQKYLSTIPLLEVPSFVAYSPVTHRVYTAYPSGLIRQIMLSSTNFAETPFANLATGPRGLSTAGQFVFATDASGAWGTHYTFAPDGTKISSRDWNYYSTEYIWSAPNQKMYFFRDDTSPNDILWEPIDATGMLGAGIDSPYHESYGWIHPIRVSPDGSIVVLGSGGMYDATSLTRLNVSLANQVSDISWVSGELKTIRSIGDVAQFQEWNVPNYGQGLVRQLPGAAHRLLTAGNNLVGVTIQSNQPAFYVMDNHFNIVAPAVLDTPSNVSARIFANNQVNFAWADVTGEENYLVERKTNNDSAWTQIGTATTSSTAYSDGTVTVGNVYTYRVTARNGAKVSAASSEVTVAMVIPAMPENVAVSAFNTSAIALSWQDVAFEAGFSVERRVGTNGVWSVIASLPENTTTFTNSGLASDTTYNFRIRATNSIGASSYSAIVGATTDAIVPLAPNLTGATASSSFLVSLSWSNVSYEDNFVVERRGTNGLWSQLAVLARDTTSYADVSALPSTAYDYRLYATNRAGASPYSNVRSVTTPALPPPAIPGGLTARAASASSISLTWTDVLGESGYRLQQRADETATWATIATLGSNTVSVLASNLVGGLQYYFRLQAFNDAGSSPFTAEVSAVPYDTVRLMQDDFDPGIDLSMWNSIKGSTATNGATGFRGSNALWFGNADARLATTVPLDVSRGATIEFVIRAGNQTNDGDIFWNNSETNETVVLEYSKDNGTTWATIQTLNTVYPSLSNWTSFTITAPAAAISAATQFRWRQQNHSGAGFDTWALDDVIISGAKPLPPVAPAFIIASESSSTSIAIYWSSASGASSYLLERKAGSNSWVALASTPASQTYFTDLNALPASAYSYRVRAVNAGGLSGFSPVAAAFTWTQEEQWQFDNFGDPTALSAAEMQTPAPDGIAPLLRFAFNLSVDEPIRTITSDSQSGVPAIWLDRASGALCVEFVRRKSSLNPGIVYEAQFSDDLKSWTTSSNLVRVTSIDATFERVFYRDQSASPGTRFSRVIVRP
jgi:fibronectin type 3 domain-containing protein